MRSLVTPFVLGTVAVAVLAYAAALALAIAAAAGDWGALHVALGPVTLVAVERSAGETSTTFGSGLALAGLAGGALNAAAAGFLRRRTRRRGDGVD